MATYAVGDIQGCFTELEALLKTLPFGSEDTLWCAGDLINRGPRSLDTLRFLYQLGSRTRVILGNHDLHLLACWTGNRRNSRKDTFDEILAAPDAPKLIEWLLSQPLLEHDAHFNVTMVHAGIPPIWTIEEARSRAAEVRRALLSEQAGAFFANMYGDTPDRWQPELEGVERLRVITNYFTRMRFCRADGTLEFASKCGPENPPEGYLPWYAHAHHACANDTIVFGHWAAMMGNTGRENFIGLDTGCVWGGALTALRLEDRQRFSVSCECD